MKALFANLLLTIKHFTAGLATNLEQYSATGEFVVEFADIGDDI